MLANEILGRLSLLLTLVFKVFRMKYAFIIFFVVLCSCQNTEIKQYAEPEQRTIYIVVHKDNPVETIETKEIKRIFLGKKGRWDNLITIKRYDYPPIQKAFYEQVLQMPITELSRYWNYQKFMAGAARPTTVKKAKDLLSLLEKDLGGVGYVTTANIPKTLKVIAQFDVVRE